jgi:DNA-binding NarL/FixJ family response regulator
LEVATELDWSLLRRLEDQGPAIVLVASLLDSRPLNYRRAFEAGAIGAVAHDSELDEIVEVVFAALRARTLLRAEVAQAMVQAQELPPPDVSVEELGWLRSIVAGRSIGEISRQAAYSERQMHRLVGRLYRKIGVSNRREAVAKVVRWEL